jgi:hypothetical protein
MTPSCIQGYLRFSQTKRIMFDWAYKRRCQIYYETWCVNILYIYLVKLKGVRHKARLNDFVWLNGASIVILTLKLELVVFEDPMKGETWIGGGKGLDAVFTWFSSDTCCKNIYELIFVWRSLKSTRHKRKGNNIGDIK